MSSNLKVNTILPSTGTTIGIGTVGGLINVVGNIDVNSTSGISTFNGLEISGIVTAKAGAAVTYYGDGSNLTGITDNVVTINNNANNRIITGSGSANTLEGESNLTFTGDTLTAHMSAATPAVIVGDSNRTGAGQHLAEFRGYWDGNHVARIVYAAGDDATNKDDGIIKFHTTPSGGSITERLRIKSSGEVHISDRNSANAGEHFFQAGSYGIRMNDTNSYNHWYIERNYGGFQSTPQVTLKASGHTGFNMVNPTKVIHGEDSSATETNVLAIRNYKSSVNTKPTLVFEASSSAGQGANSSIQGLAGTDAGGSNAANDSGMKFIVRHGGSGTVREAFTIKKDGNMYFPAGQGIDFSATSDATGMTSELFADYERGVHTFAVTGSSGNPTVSIASNYNKLYYTKIGDMVHVTGELRWTISSHGSGDLQISIPFTSDSTTNSNSLGSAQAWNVNWTYRSGQQQLFSEVQPGVNYMRFRIGGSNTLYEDFLDCGSSYQKTANSGYGVEYQVSIWYRTG